MSRSDNKPRTKRELMIHAWNRLECAAVGARELREIQRAIAKRFGEGAADSPAAIARVLADVGAELRHPEVIEFDARWRESQIESEAGALKGLKDFASEKPLSLKQTETLIKKLERARKKSERAGGQMALEQARKMAVDAREAAQSRTKDRTLDQSQRAEQAEIAEWLRVWIQTPVLFEDWLELRRRSPDFRRKFSA